MSYKGQTIGQLYDDSIGKAQMLRKSLARQRAICPTDADHVWKADEPHGLTDTCVKCGTGRA